MKTKLLSLLTSLSFFAYAYAWDGSIATGFAGGQGTAADPYQIANAEQLAFIAQQVNEEHRTYYGTYFVLTADIDLFGKNGEDTIQWTPIGLIAQDVAYKGEDAHPDHHPFQGSLDGQNHTIRNLYIRDENLVGGALFRHISLATLRNINFENVQIFVKSSAAALCSHAISGSIIENCHVLSGNITVSGSGAGGITAGIRNYFYEAWSSYVSDHYYTHYYSVIKNCTNNADIRSLCVGSGGASIGGITGSAGGRGANDSQTMHIIGCTNTGSITGRLGFGGICGAFYEQISEPLLIDSCINYGNLYRKGPLDSSSDYGNFGVGGILGATVSKGSIQHCLNAGDILNADVFYEPSSGKNPPTSHGGIVGYLPGGRVKNCVNIGFSDGKMPYGGICGYAGLATSSHVENCLNAGSANDKFGGITYKLGSSSYAENCVTVFYDCAKFSPHNYTVYSISNSIEYPYFPPPTNLASTHIKNCYFDVQTNSYDYETYGLMSKDYGQRYTHQMLGNNLSKNLKNENWVYTEGMYPRPKGTEDFDIAILAATPIFLNYVSDEEYDNLHNIHASFTLGEVEGVTWSANSQLRIEGNRVNIVEEIPEDSVYTLYAHYGKATRKYQFGAKTVTPVEIVPETKSQPVKFLHNGQLLIRKGDKVYTIQGQLYSFTDLFD